MDKFEKQTQIPEAVASATYSIISPKGFNVLFTIRDKTGGELLDIMDAVETTLVAKGYKPQPARGGFPPKKEAVVVGKCPTCGADLIEGVTKTGKKYHKCSTNKWNPQTQKAEGCAYILWLDK